MIVVVAREAASTACATSTTTYVSLAPPILSVALRPDSRTAQLIVRTGRFSVSVLVASQQEVARRAGRRSLAADKLADVGITAEPLARWRRASRRGRLNAVLWCTVTGVTPAGDHLVIFGQVGEFLSGAGEPPPLPPRHRRRYLASRRAAIGVRTGGVSRMSRRRVVIADVGRLRRCLRIPADRSAERHGRH